MVSNMDQECGKELKVIVMLENGEWEKLKDMEFMFGSMEIDIRDNSKTASNMDKGPRNLQMVISIKVNIQKESLMVMDSITGKMEAISKETSKKV